MTKAKRYNRYSAEFKREAILRAGEEGVTDWAVCDELGISTRQFRRWRDALQLLGNDAFPGQGRTRDEEMAGLKREFARSDVGRHRSIKSISDHRGWFSPNTSDPPQGLLV